MRSTVLNDEVSPCKYSPVEWRDNRDDGGGGRNLRAG